MKNKAFSIALAVVLFISIMKSAAQNYNLTLDGTNDFISCGTGLDITGSMSVEAWIYPTDFKTYGWENTIVGNDYWDVGGAPSIRGYVFRYGGSTGDLQFVFAKSSGGYSWTTTSVSNVLSLNTWQHVAAVYDQTTVKLYVNGVQVGSDPLTYPIISSDIAARIGTSPGDPSRLMKGSIDEVRVWNDARTAEEIRLNMYRELPDPSAEPNLVAYYKFNETSGTSASDSKGLNTGTLTNMSGTEWGPSPALFGPRQALDFNGDDDYVSVGAFELGNRSALTIELWLCAHSWNPASPDANISNLAGHEDASALFRIGDAGISNDQPQFILNGGTRLNSETHLGINIWYHLAAVYDGSSMKIYINGVLNATQALSGPITNTSSTVIIGGSPSSLARYLDGYLDEIRIWSTGRTPEQIRENMCRNLTGNETGLLAYYPSDNSKGLILPDISGNGHHGTLTNGPSWISSSAFSTWLNTTSSSWSSATNWSRSTVPSTENECVGIYGYGGSSVQPQSLSQIPVTTLVIGNGASLSLANLTIDNLLFNVDYSFADSYSSSARIYNTASKTLSVGNGIHLNLTSSATLFNEGNLNIGPGGMMTIGPSGSVNNSGNITIGSTASGTGSFVNRGVVSGSGTFSAQRYIGAWSDVNHGWHFLSSPVASQAIQTGFVPDPPSANEDFFKWDEVNDIWFNAEAEGGGWNPGFETNFETGKGYLVAYSSDQTKTFSGTFNSSNITKNNLTNTAASSHSGWNLLGNPYPSAVEWGISNENWVLTNVDNTAKIWNEASASYTDISDPGYIPAMQGFMVRVWDGTTGSVTIYNGAAKHNSTPWYKEAELNKIRLTVHDVEGNTAQETNIRFNPGATTGYDTQFDSYFLGGYAPLFHTTIDSRAVSTNTFPRLNGELTIPITFEKKSGSQYYIDTDGTGSLDPPYPIYLTDLKTGTCNNLTTHPVYSFTAAEGDNPERFILHFNAVGVDETPFPVSTLPVLIWNIRNNFQINNPEKLTGNFTIFNTTGVKIMEGTLSGEIRQIIPHNLLNGIVIVFFQTESGTMSSKVPITR